MTHPVRIMDEEFNQLSETTDYVSIAYTRSHFGVGDFTLVMHKNAYGVEHVKKGNLIALTKDRVGIVRARNISLDESGKASENWQFTGITLKGICQQRITTPPEHTAYERRSGDAETVMKHYVDKYLVNPDDPDRKYPDLVIAPNQNRGEHVSWQSRFKILAEELEEIGQTGKLGWNITLDTDNDRLVFDVVEGKNLAEDNEEGNSPVFFSPEFGNIRQQTLTDSDTDLKNVGYIAGQGEGVERLVVEVGAASGRDRMELFVDARDIGDEESTEEEEKEQLERRGGQRLEEASNELFFEAQILNPMRENVTTQQFDTFLSHFQPVYKDHVERRLVSPFIYGTDWDLGDITTVMNRDWGFIVNKQITELTETYEASGFSLDATFGRKRPDLISKIKGDLKQYDNELKR